MISAKVICDSVSPKGDRLTTMEVEFHRFILSEINTHRVFSRNYQSSRAVPIEKMIEQVRNNPAMPVHWGKNQPGMVANEECNSEVWDVSCDEMGTREAAWESASYYAAWQAEELHKAGYHKQIVNRLLEPFMWTKGVITASEEGFNSFFKLRSHKDAQPEIKVLSDKMKEAMENSIPIKLEYGEWHLPYFGVRYNDGGMEAIKKSIFSDGNTTVQSILVGAVGGIENAIKISTSCVAQVSYRKLDDSLEKAEKIYDMLNLPKDGVYPEDPPHFSPAEHVAKCEIWSNIVEIDSLAKTEFYNNYSGNFNIDEFVQYRKMLEQGFENYFIKGENK